MLYAGSDVTRASGVVTRVGDDVNSECCNQDKRCCIVTSEADVVMSDVTTASDVVL